nr:MAG TPA: Honey bee toxin [Crassvirales sp.]
MKELISELSTIECSILFVSIAIIITIILCLIMSGCNRN